MRFVDILSTAVYQGENIDWKSLLPQITQANAREKDENQSLPLHVAAANKASLEVIMALVDAYPKSAEWEDQNGRLPLHLAAGNKAPLEVIKALVDAYPYGAKEKDKNQSLPLHLAVGNKAPLEVIMALVEAYPEGVKEKDHYQRLPLYLAAENKAPPEVIMALVGAYPKGAKEKDHYQRLPLHLATGNKAPLEVIMALLEAYPEGANDKDKWQQLPLHYAVEKKALPEIIKALVEAYPDGVKEKDQNQKLPLHLAVENIAPLEVIKALVEAHPAGVKETDGNGRTPLDLYQTGSKRVPTKVSAVLMYPCHFLLRNQGKPEVIKALLKALPESAAERDDENVLPLHVAIEMKAPPEVILELIERHPVGVKQSATALGHRTPLRLYHDRCCQNGPSMEDPAVSAALEFPLHFLLSTGASLEVVKALVEAFPEEVSKVDNTGGKPLLLAQSFQASNELTRYLCGVYLNNSKTSDGNKRAFDGDMLIQFVEYFFRNSSAEEFEGLCGDIRAFCNEPVYDLSMMRSDLTEALKKNALLFLVHSLSYTSAEQIASVHLHLLGNGCSGKTTLKSMLEKRLEHWSSFSHRKQQLLEKRKAVGIPLSCRTVGMEIKVVHHLSEPRVKFIIYDYGGQEHYQVNHSRFLQGKPNSIFFILVPLWDVEAGEMMADEKILQSYTKWLRFINSTIPLATTKNCVTIVNFKEKCSDADKLARVLKDIQAVQDEWSKKWGFEFVSKEVQAFDVNDRDQVWEFVDPVNSLKVGKVPSSSMPLCVREVLSSRLGDQASAASSGGIWQRLFGSKIDKWKKPQSRQDFEANIRDVLMKSYKNMLEKKQGSLSSVTVEENVMRILTQIVFDRLIEHHEIAVVKDWVIPDLQWLTKDVLGQIAEKLENEAKRYTSGAVSENVFMLTNDVIDDWTNNAANKYFARDKTVLPKLLEDIGACVPIGDGAGRWFPAFVGSGIKLEKDAFEKKMTDFMNTVDKNEPDVSNQYFTWRCLRLFKLQHPEQKLFLPEKFVQLFVEAFKKDGRKIELDSSGKGFENAIILTEPAYGDDGDVKLIIMRSDDVDEMATTIVLAVMSKIDKRKENEKNCTEAELIRLMLVHTKEKVTALSRDIIETFGLVELDEYGVNPAEIGNYSLVSTLLSGVEPGSTLPESSKLISYRALFGVGKDGKGFNPNSSAAGSPDDPSTQNLMLLRLMDRTDQLSAEVRGVAGAVRTTAAQTRAVVEAIGDQILGEVRDAVDVVVETRDLAVAQLQLLQSLDL